MSVSNLQTSLLDRSRPEKITPPVRRATPGVRAKYALTVLAFLLPSAIPLAMFVLGPMVAAAWISLQKWNLISPLKEY